ncbi:hypothetical protein IA01_10740 [Flavobacterium psychrophilum]|uniref:GmrSD restriction endonucleases N-terminal domain-containing protein n=4 Tax=Flavobacterium psychrophilum TaxID=96345 RepID=A6H1K8_FLAPJ|nr:DUF262 domain-containing protein [Flavobacterium psychrophilum]AIG30909.1 hypothetical protein IA03_10725 [Flavobacterium psychrophilum]AIG33183.1 hypothetical protein IA01_10740 [Flavobacterium psychrophilum]AIG35336.1 hypothetical protein IA02_10120 [Flavobacterium psychrophilum]AIG37696.1 hypothetical protein IA04_10605 [Flavobacterium psychrophilum]AIG39968.1 hypothetical protein IA05_10725 [Flavobacterium psychrophilum]
MNIISTLPISKLILNEDTPERTLRVEHYLIPYYQRGYRWEIENVKALLDDIHNFIDSKEEFYCLQPIVVVPNLDENNKRIWEVIDGQQRLTTLYIIFKYLGITKYTILFGERTLSNNFLENLSHEKYNDSNPDFHFMSEAYKCVKKWFENKTKNDMGYVFSFVARLTKDVQVIWYQINELEKIEEEQGDNTIEETKIDIFNRLNIGKIPLTDAELIRALLLSKIKIGLSEREALMRQAEISNEWHQIETTLRNEEFWYFLNNNSIEKTSSAIELVFNLIAEDSKLKYSTYLWFEKQIRAENELDEKVNADELWSKTKDYFNRLFYWYNNSKLYHHIGYLLAIQDNNFNVLKNIISNSNIKKDIFQNWVFDQIVDSIKHIKLENLDYEKNKSELHKVFLLHNIIATDNLNSAQKNVFPFNLYKKIKNDKGWSIEHIHAQQSKEIKESKAMKQWLIDTLKALENIHEIETESKSFDNNEKEVVVKNVIKIDDVLRNEIVKLIQEEKVNYNDFNNLRIKVTRLFESESVHVLDNLALLAKSDNSALNNSIFPVKRNKIIQMEKDGKFIPLTTRNAFLKYYNEKDIQPFYWSKSDKQNYFANIEETIKPFLTKETL